MLTDFSKTNKIKLLSKISKQTRDKLLKKTNALINI